MAINLKNLTKIPVYPSTYQPFKQEFRQRGKLCSCDFRGKRQNSKNNFEHPLIILYRLVTEHYFCNFATENKISDSPYGTFQYSRRI